MRILFTPYGGGSIAHIIRSLAVADELKSRGHQILFTAPTTKKELIERAGYPVYGEGHPEVNLNDSEDQSLDYFTSHREQFIAWMADELNAARDFQPDIIVNSPNFFGTPAGSKYGIPYISIINAQWLMEFKGLLGLGKSANHPAHAAIRAIGKPIFSRRFDQQYIKHIASFYEALEVPRVPKKRHQLHNQNPAIIPGIPEFEPLSRHKRKDLHYVGPLFWNGFEQADFEPNKLFKEFGKKPFVYVSLGGSIYRKQTYQELTEALAKKKEWNILLSLGPNFDRQDFIPDQDHFVIQTYTPGLKACEAADLIINTGGHGTVMQALWHGKPVIALPHNIDQGSIASRLQELGVGVNLNPVGLRDFASREKYFQKATKVHWSDIIKEAERLLGKPSIHRKAVAFSQKLRQYDQAAKKAADLIEHYATQAKSP